MAHDHSTQPIKWAARLPHVRDVTLFGTADLDVWRRRLRSAGLAPVDDGGRARIMILGAESRFLGIPFGEVSISVAVQPRATPEMPLDADEVREAAFLLQAYNSVRLFAFCERRLFRTPYQHGGVRVRLDEASGLASIEVSRRREVVFRAELAAADAAEARAPTSEADTGWDGIIHLPSHEHDGASDRFFIAQIRGAARSYAFVTDRDRLRLSPGHDDYALRALVESDFVARQWSVRADGRHAKSKTYRTTQRPRSI